MMTFAYEHQGIISGMGHSFLYDNARPRLGNTVTELLSKYAWGIVHMSHVAYTETRVPKLKQTMGGDRFSSLEELSAAVTRAT